MDEAGDAKPRSTSKLDNLPEARKTELRDGLLGGWSHAAALAWLESECGVSSQGSALTTFWKRHCVPLRQQQRLLAAIKAESITADVGLTDWDAASIERLRQMVFEFMDNPNANIEDTERLFKLLLKSRDQETDRRKLAMMEAKIAEAKTAAADTKLTAEEQNRRLREILK